MSQYTFSSLAGPGLASYNVHSNPLYTEAIDYVIDCAATHNYSYGFESCATISLFNSVPARSVVEPDPVIQDMVGVLVQPIFPINNQSTLTGIAAGTISWKALLTNVIPEDVEGVDCVIESDVGAFTFHICHGVPEFKGMGDLHETHYSGYRTSGSLLSGNIAIARSASYTLSFYPTSELQESFETTQPTQAAIIMLAIFAFCGLLLALYDRLTRREFDRNQAVLDTKRRFVRFISHEIRTPLNTVRLGMKLLEVEMGKFSGKLARTSSTDLALLMKTTLRSWKELADEIIESSESAVEVLNDLLNYDKIEIGTMKLEFSYFDVRTLVEKTVTAMQVQAQQKGINLELNCTWLRSFGALSGDSGDGGEMVDMGGEDRTVIGDVARMGQVLRNLISNALKFTPAHGLVSVEGTSNTFTFLLIRLISFLHIFPFF
jgi:signal transduction histidine kinase